MENNPDLLKHLQEKQSFSGICYEDILLKDIIEGLEKRYIVDIIREYQIVNLLYSDSSFYTIKWMKRPFILTDFEIEKKYGTNYFNSMNP